MKAIQYKEYGDSTVLTETEIPTPAAKSGQVLVEIKAASVNPFDIILLSGMLKSMIPLTLPVTFGGDFAGIIKTTGDGVTAFAAGDAVYGTALVLTGGSGSFARMATADAGSVAKLPTGITATQAAALPLVGVSAIQALEDTMKLARGQKILIHGAAGGIGHIAVQIAKAIGAHIIATAAADDAEFVKSLGADEVIDYKTQDFAAIVKDADAVFDTVGGDVTVQSFSVLKKGGVLVSMKGAPDAGLAETHGVTAVGMNTKITTDRLNRLAAYVTAGKVTVTVSVEVPMGSAAEASAKSEGKMRGKAVVTMD